MAYQIAALLLLVVFYGIYAGKLLLQRKRGIRTDQMAKGRKDKRLLRTEAAMKTATYAVLAAEIASIAFFDGNHTAPVIRAAGLCLAGAGVVVFGTAVHTMRDSWRAGIPEKDRTELITAGIFRISRNPAFVGFDLLYIGILTAFFQLGTADFHPFRRNHAAPADPAGGKIPAVRIRQQLPRIPTQSPPVSVIRPVTKNSRPEGRERVRKARKSTPRFRKSDLF